MAKVADFKPATRNANKHTARGLGAIEKSVRTDGYGDPMLAAADGEMISGSARLETVASVFGVDAEPIIVHSDGTRPVIHVRDDIPNAADKRAVRLALAANRAAELDLSWDVEVLAGLDADVLEGLWTADELSDLGQQWADEQKANQDDPGAQVDKAEELQAKWQVSTGQLWQLGAHRLICGDCTDAAVVARVMGGEKARLVFTDPPYNYASENGIYGADVSKAMNDLKNAEWDHDFDLRPALDVMPLAQDVTVYVCSSHHLAPTIWAWMKEWATHHSWCVWSKPNPMPSLSKRHWTWSAELIPYATRGRHTFNFPAEGHALCVWTINKAKETEHPTEKPVEVPEHAIAHSSKVGDLVFDGFLGSGTTLIACERLGRKCRAIDIAPKYCAVALERWATMTGQTPVLVQDGKTTD